MISVKHHLATTIGCTSLSATRPKKLTKSLSPPSFPLSFPPSFPPSYSPNRIYTYTLATTTTSTHHTHYTFTMSTSTNTRTKPGKSSQANKNASSALEATAKPDAHGDGSIVSNSKSNNQTHKLSLRGSAKLIAEFVCLPFPVAFCPGCSPLFVPLCNPTLNNIAQFPYYSSTIPSTQSYFSEGSTPPKISPP